MKTDTIEAEKERNTFCELQVMFAGPHCLGVFADEIDAIADWRTPTPLPNAPASVLGVVCIRGRMLTVLEPAALLGGTSSNELGKIVALRGDEQLALAVNRTGAVIKVAPNELPDELRAASEPDALVLGVIRDGELSISVLDSKQLFATAMRGRERRRRRF